MGLVMPHLFANVSIRATLSASSLKVSWMLCRRLMVVAASYSHNMLLLADAAGLEGRSRLLAVFRDLTSLPASTAMGASVGVSGLRETVTELEVLLPGEACEVQLSATS